MPSPESASIPKGMILITGASSGIGQACAQRFAKEGRSLILLARREDRLKTLKSKIEAEYKIQVHTFKVDISRRGEVEAFAIKEKSLLEQVTTLINNAGLAKGFGSFQEGNPSDWETMIDTNIKGLLYVSRAVVPFFLERKAGHIIHIGSVAGRWAYANGNVYCATKSAVAMLTETMRIDLVGKGIRVTNICPGMVNTEFSLVRFNDQKKADAVYEGVDALKAEDIAESVVWCANQPPRVNIQELVIYPTNQASVGVVHRSSQ